jgi:predicted homoserine dehydrogenase-like protein
VLYGRADIQPLDQPVAEAIAIAKCDLVPDSVMGRIGECDYRGWSIAWADARRARALPLGLAENARITRPIGRGEALTYDNCAIDESKTIVQLRRVLDQADICFETAREDALF